MLIVTPGQRFGPGSEAAPRFKSPDVEAIRNQINAVERVAPMVNKTATAVYQANNWSTVINGSSNDYFQAGNWELAAAAPSARWKKGRARRCASLAKQCATSCSDDRTRWGARSASSSSPARW